MTVRLTPSESDSSPSAPVAVPLDMTEPPVPAPGPAALTSDPAAAPLGADPVAPGSAGVDATPVPTGAVTVDSRVALREARRIRRRTAWLCAAVVALALALTITVVSLARTRPIPQSSGPVGPATTALVLVPSVPNPGATAPEGGTS